MTWLEEHVVCIYATFVGMILLPQILADKIIIKKNRTFQKLRYTYIFANFVFNLLVYSFCNGVISVSPMEIGDDLQAVQFLPGVN